MGGPGSSRWINHWNKTLVEDCHKLTIYALKSTLYPGYLGGFTWKRGERETGSISFRVEGDTTPAAIRLWYSIRDSWTGEKVYFDYQVPLQTIRTVWGSLRYWFSCPLSTGGKPCARRVGALYLPPGGRYFGCRHCYDLTYQSSRESKIWDSFFIQMANMMQVTHPGATAADLRYILEERRRPPEGFYQRVIPFDWPGFVDRYSNYLTSDELCQQAGLSPVDLALLDSARLLLPDHDGKYRPKLAGWGQKLAYLLAQGWEIDEIKRWAKGRWATLDPRQWPPERECWIVQKQ